ncbi:MAG: asparaginase [Aestuariivita sp.]|uniref:asparaginase n=1 Tax=Aestuariivita sp. TaxID=1872407 RepID=UPI003BB1AFC3
MSQPVPMAEIWRGDLLESLHTGHAVICDDTGQIVDAWGAPDTLIYPRSSSKMVQALPLLESGAADRAGLTTQQLALACASHSGARIHTDRVQAWLGNLGLDDDAFRCGAHLPYDEARAHEMIRADETPCQYHNNCSGKHCGFLTLAKDMGAGPEYVDPDHPVQLACKDAFERATGQDSPGYGIDGCSAPNFQTTVLGLARAMARFAAAPSGSAEARLREAMMLHPELVAGEGRSCTRLMRAMGGAAAIKTGAEAVFVAILPRQKLGVALKITDGATRASECAITAILVRLGVLDRAHEAAQAYMNAPILNRRRLTTGLIRPAAGLLSP